MTGTGAVSRVSAAAAPPAALSDDAAEFIRLEQSTGTWPIAPALAQALAAFGDALIAGDVAAARRWLAPEVELGPDLEARLRGAQGSGHSIVACARLGEQRLVKLRLDGAHGGATLLLRWVPTGSDWRVAVLEAVVRFRRAARLSSVLQSVLIANRGEIARRVIRGCRALGIRTVAVYSEADAGWPHVADADEAVLIGPAPARESYLDVERILDAARRDERPGRPSRLRIPLRELALRPGLRGGRADLRRAVVAVIQQMGDKVGARRLMAAAGVPVVPGSDGPVDSVEAAREVAGRIGYPVMIKAAAGGGGIGMMRVKDEAGLAAAFASAQRRAQSAFGSGALFVERFLEAPRHVEVQVFGDAGGRVVHLHERECSIQRRHQKLVEESPAPNLSAVLKARLTSAAVAGARAVGYVNAGTMEFIVQGDEFYFLEMNTRLQVEHPVTEEVTGLDLVAAQLRVASGEPLPWTQEQVTQRGASIECRIYAEDPAKGFMPSPGRITRLALPEGPGVRLECGVAEGVEVTVHYDPLLAKLITTGRTRDEAIARMRAALDGVRGRGREDRDPVPAARDGERRLPGRRRAHADGRAGRLRLSGRPQDSRDGDDSHRRADPGDDPAGILAQRESRRLPGPLGARASGPYRAGGPLGTHHVGDARPVGGSRGRRARPAVGSSEGASSPSSSPTGARRWPSSWPPCAWAR